MTAYRLFADGALVKQFCSNEYMEALEEAAQLDWQVNSPEMNDGEQGSVVVELITVE